MRFSAVGAKNYRQSLILLLLSKVWACGRGIGGGEVGGGWEGSGGGGGSALPHLSQL